MAKKQLVASTNHGSVSGGIVITVCISGLSERQVRKIFALLLLLASPHLIQAAEKISALLK